jgi:hypothetical protein
MSYPKAWWFVPRLLHERSCVCVEERSSDGQAVVHWKPHAEIGHLAAMAASRRAA